MADTYGQFDVTTQVPNFDYTPLEAQNADFLSRYTGAISGLETIPALADRYSNQLNIPNLREQSLQLGEIGEGLRTNILNMPRQVAGTSRESLLTEGQRAGLVQSKQQPLMESYTEVGRQGEQVGARLTSAETNLNKLMGYEMAQQERSLLPFEKEFTTIERMQAMKFSGYTFREKLELDRLMGNAERGYKWTTDEANRANALALKEWDYKIALDSIKEKSAQERGNYQYMGQLAGWF